MKLFICILSLITTLCYLQSVVFCQSKNETNITATESTTIAETTVVETTSTVPPKNISCEKHNNDCKACVAYSECYYCDTDNKCHYKLLDILTDNECPYKKIHYLTCRVNFQYLMIGVGVLILNSILNNSYILLLLLLQKEKGIKKYLKG
uniref:U33-Theriditoxin-Lha1a_1 n=1 Tax=Latrodectus hasselti TaxID=256736 RepID=A0A482ZB86_LATHA